MTSRTRVLLDGRVFSTGAHDRGMGRYVAHLHELLCAEGHDVTLLLFRDCHLRPDDPLITRGGVRFADYDPEALDLTTASRIRETRAFTHFLTQVLVAGAYHVYIDGTPFLRPCRFDILVCPVVAVCYDFIPLKHSEDYLNGEGVRDFYLNGMARVAKADAVISISNTVAGEVKHYLGIPADRISTICPKLEDRYIDFDSKRTSRQTSLAPFLFSIVGSHRSKNPTGAVEVYRHVLEQGELEVRINVPTAGQYADLQRLGLPAGVETTYSISEDRKIELQSKAAAVAHLSIEEGFGIPLLEALFLGTRVIALDIAMNREIIGRTQKPLTGAVLLLRAEDGGFEDDDLHALLSAPPKPGFHDDIRTWYLQHWENSGPIATRALETAVSTYDSWFKNVAFQIVTSIPGASCGVADYSMAFTRSTNRNVIVFFSEGEYSAVGYLQNVRASSELDYELFSRAHPDAPTLFNFAFSSALFPGIVLLQSHGEAKDVLLIHEREYADAFKVYMSMGGLFDGFMARQTKGEDADATRRALAFAFSSAFNRREAQPTRGAFPGDWLSRLPVRLVHHLTPPVVEQMQAIQRAEPEAPINELAAIEDKLEFAPLGIDDRASAAVARAGELVRRRYGVQPQDLVVGHFGLVVAGIKRLPEIARGVAREAARLSETGGQGRRIHFLLVGRVIDPEVEGAIVEAFARRGLQGRLLRSNPLLEDEFEAQMTACDLVACLRTQRRGQLSHILVRGHALGRPLIVNRDSGYGYDPVTTIDDERIEEGVGRVIRAALSPAALAGMRKRSRARWESDFRGDRSLNAILQTGSA